MQITLVILVITALLISCSQALFYPYRRGRSPSGGGKQRSGRTYADIARVINPQPYSSPGIGPYPGQPFWSYG